MSDQTQVTLRQVMVATAMHVVQVRILWREWWQHQTGKR